MGKVIASGLCLLSVATSFLLVLGFDMYDPEKQICCNGTVHRYQDGIRCCGKESYHPKDSLCCFGRLLPLPGKGLYGCCGEPHDPVVFPYGRHDCCRGKVVDVPDSESYYGCCESSIYYPERESCCDGVIKPVSSNGNQSCCGDKLMIDDERQLCCQTFPKQRSGVATQSVVHQREGDRTTCCELEPMDWKREMCCGGEIKPRNQTIWCCGGRELYDSAVQICCHGHVHPKERDKECCWSSGALYDPATEMCCDSEVVSLREIIGNKTACCAITHANRVHGQFLH